MSIRLEETAKALFKWLSKHQFQSNNSDQSQQEQTAQRTNQNSERLPIIWSKCGEIRAYQGANGFGSACHWLNYWPESFSCRSRNPLITFVRYRSTFRTVIWRLLYVSKLSLFYENVVLNELIRAKMPPCKEHEAEVSRVSPSSERISRSQHLIYSLDAKFLCFPFKIDAASVYLGTKYFIRGVILANHEWRTV